MTTHEQLLAQLVDGILVVDLSGLILYANPSASQLFAKPLTDLIGSDFGYPVVVEDSSEIALLRKEEALYAEMRARWIDWEGQTAALVSLRDIQERKHLELALKHMNALNDAVVNSLSASVAVIDHEGVILRVNHAWQAFAEQNGASSDPSVQVGANYLEICRRSAQTDHDARRVVVGMERILRGESDQFQLAYPCDTPEKRLWFMLRIHPWQMDEMNKGLVISHIDITDYRAEMLEEGQQLSDALAFATLQQMDQLILRNSEAPRMYFDVDLWMDDYEQILEWAVDQRMYRVAHPVRESLEQLSEQLGANFAQARDLVQLHLRTLDRKHRRGASLGRMRAYIDEGRILILELMGYMVSYYRKRALSRDNSI